MAESSGEKTEMPTQKKLRDARNKGQVCTSKDIVSTACLVVLFAVVAMSGKMLIDDFSLIMGYISERISEDPIKTVSGGVTLSTIVILKHSLIYALVAALVGIIGNVAQIGFLFTLEPLKPDFNKAINNFHNASIRVKADQSSFGMNKISNIFKVRIN